MNNIYLNAYLLGNTISKEASLAEVYLESFQKNANLPLAPAPTPADAASPAGVIPDLPPQDYLPGTNPLFPKANFPVPQLAPPAPAQVQAPAPATPAPGPAPTPVAGVNPIAQAAQDPNIAKFKKVHGTDFDPNSAMDRWKLKQLGQGNAGVGNKDFRAAGQPGLITGRK